MPRPLLLLALLLSALSPAHAAINNTFPGDYTALPAGTTSVTAYLFNRHLEGKYVNGTRQGDLELDGWVPALRVAHFIDLGGLRANLMATLNGADMEVSASGLPSSVKRSVSGLGDLRLATTLYPITDLAQGHHLGFTLMAIVPSGAYDAQQPFNAGENRTRWLASLGWIRRLSPEFTIDLIGEAGWYGDNSDYLGGNRLAQAPSQAFTGYLRYQPNRALQLFVGAEFNRGGSQSLNGVDLDNPADNQRHFLGAILALSKMQFINLRYAHDAKVENGLSYQELGLRYIQLF